MADNQQVNPEYQKNVRDYQANRVGVNASIVALKDRVKNLPVPVFSDSERDALEDTLDRIEIERDPLEQLKRLTAYESFLRHNYIISLGITMRNGKYGDKRDRKAMRDDAEELFNELNGYKKEEER